MAAAEVWAVARHEFMGNLRRRTFLFTTFAVPAVGLAAGLLTGGSTALLSRGLASAFDVGDVRSAAVPDIRIGYVDPGGFVASTDIEYPGARFVELDAADVRAAVGEGRVDVAYVLPPDYPAVRDVVLIAQGLQASGREQPAFLALMRANIWPEGSRDDLDALRMPGRRVDLALDLPRYRVAQGNIGAIMLPVLVGLLLYSSIFTASSFLLQSVTSEKESRILEVLLTSARPLTILAGKVLGLGSLGLLQMTVWTAFGLLMYRMGAVSSALTAGVRFGPGVLALAVVYFLLGYFFFASLMGAVGALAPSFKESSALTFVVVFPAWIPFFMLDALLTDPNGSVARALMFLPPTAPLVALIRVTSGAVPMGDILISVALLLVTSALVLVLAARVFSVQILLSSGFPAPRALWLAVRGASID